MVREQAKSTRPLHRLRPITGLQFRENGAHMTFDCTDGQREVLGNLLVGGTLLQQAEHLQFACTQRFEERRRGLISGGMTCPRNSPRLYHLMPWTGSKRSQHAVQIRGWSLFAFLLAQLGKKPFHWGSFV